MSTREWFLARRPEAPGDLSRAMLDTLAEAAVPGEDNVHALLRATMGELSRARSQPGRVRASAFALLAADGLLTHACEGALEVDGLESIAPEADRHVRDGPQSDGAEAVLGRLLSEVAAA